MAGTRFIKRILVRPSIFRLMAKRSREPMELISAMTSVPSRGASREAERAMSPSHKNTGTAEQSTPTPKVEAKIRAEMPSMTDLEKRMVWSPAGRCSAHP